MPMGANVAEGLAGETCFLVGTVRGMDGKPVEGAKLDIWQADADGLYESQLGVEEPTLRAVFHTGADGKYVIRTIAPPGYSIPMDGTVGDLLRKTDISHFRPAHIHFVIGGPGYREVATALYVTGDDHLESDTVFGVTDSLVIGVNEKDPSAPIPGLPSIKYYFMLASGELSKAGRVGADPAAVSRKVAEKAS